MKVVLFGLLSFSAHGFLGGVPRSDKGMVARKALEERTTEVENLSGRIPDCPATIWDANGIDIKKEVSSTKINGPCPLEWQAPTGSEGVDYFMEKKDEIGEKLLKHGCIWLRGFEMMKKEEGFRQMYEALGMDPCLDPIHTSGLRAFASESDAIYEEVNKQNLREHYIGLHQESTHKKTATFGAFVCFKPATIEGGEFLIADAAKILKELDPKVAQEMYEKQIRISVSNLDLDLLASTGPLKEPLLEGAKQAIDTLVAPKFDMDLEMVYGADGKPYRLQAIEQCASPINRHPITKVPLWFCNIHNHARYLRDNRPCNVPEVGMTEVYFGDLSPIPHEMLDHINTISEQNIQHIPMQPGDVLLCDNYRILHGRDIFDGDRYHAVTWFKSGFGIGEQSSKNNNDPDGNGGKPDNFLNNFINKFVVDAF